MPPCETCSALASARALVLCYPQRVAPDEYACGLRFDDLALLPGNYSVRVHPLDPEGVRVFDTMERGVTVRGASRELGLVRLAHRWNPAPSGGARDE